VNIRIPASPNAARRPACHSSGVALRCLIVDDSSAFLQAATALLEREGMTVVGAASTSDEAVRRARELRPDIVLVDVMLGPESGFDLARRLAADTSNRPVILISTQAEADIAELIARTPALGFVPKSELSARAIERLIDRA
jgi:DNA-binding NarL/FixJ family response regulator